MTYPNSAVAADIVALYKQTYDDTIAQAYSCRGTLKNYVTVRTNAGQAGTSVTEPIMGIVSTYERNGSEVMQPQQPTTANFLLTFKDIETSVLVPATDAPKIINPTYVGELSKRQANAIIANIENKIVQSVFAAPGTTTPAVVPASQYTASLLDKSLELRGDGTSRTGGSLVEADLKPFDFKCLAAIKGVFDSMGVADGERYVYLPTSVINLLLQSTNFTNTQYVPAGVAPLQNSGLMYNILGLTIMTAQLNPNGGLPTGTIGSTAYTTGFAFTREALLLVVDSPNPVTAIWDQYDRNSIAMAARNRAGAVVKNPPQIIQLPTSTV